MRLADGSEPHWPSEVGGDNLAPGKPVSYGFGWFLDPYQGHTRLWHSGSTMGFRTVIQRFTDGSGLTVILLANRTDLDPTQLSLQVADLFFRNPKTVKLNFSSELQFLFKEGPVVILSAALFVARRTSTHSPGRI